jgi:protein-tyrosine-phosphatase
VSGISVFSSGICAGFNGTAPISPYAAEILARYGLESDAAAGWQRTTADLVRASDVIVFMESEHRRFCEDWIDLARQRVEVWEIEDIGPMDAAQIPKEVERTFEVIRQRTDSLLRALDLRD